MAMKPIVTELPGAMLALYEALFTVTCDPDWLATPFQRLLICWFPGNVQAAVQPFSAAERVLVIVSCPWNPPGQLLVTEYAAEQAPLAPVDVGDGVGDAEGDAEDGDGEGDGDPDDPEFTFTENEFVASPAPPCQSSKPASTSMR